MGRAEIGEVLELLRPDRIGHGILAAGDAELMKELREREVVLEICPTSNLLTKALADEEAVRDVFRTFVENGVALHDRDGRAGDDADAPPRRVRPAAANRRADAGGARGGQRARPRREFPPRPERTPPARIPPSADSSVAGAAVACRAMTGSDDTKPDLTERQLQIVALIARGCSNDEVGAASRHLAQNGEGALRRAAPEARRAEAAADSCRVQGAHRRGPPRA